MFKKRNLFVLGICLFLIGFVLAAIAAPVNLVFSNNVTSSYDEGSFFVNWTAGGTDEINYTVYIFSNNTLYSSSKNNSVLGYSFSNITEANYTFIVEAENSTGDLLNSTSNISIYVDSTAPTITLPEYTNSTLKRNNQNLTLNISLSDSLSGLTGSICLIDVNGTNQSVSVSSEWCNSSEVLLTNLADGNHTIKVYVNDTVNNLGLNNSYEIQIDTTAPAPTSLTLSSASLSSLVITFSGAEGTCTASGTGTKSISSSTLTVTGLICGTSYAYTITCTDTSGNAGTSSSTSFTTSGCGGGNYVPSFWSNTFATTSEQFAEGFVQELPIKNRVKIKVNNEDHYVGIIELTSSTAKINISSDPQQELFQIGDSKKFEVTGDEFYDILVTLNSIKNNKANITILSINEKIISEIIQDGTGEKEEGLGETSNESQNETQIGSSEKNNLAWLWVILILIVLGVVIYFFKEKLKKRFV